jgi:DNA-binding Lrp family transcriptional regulator
MPRSDLSERDIEVLRLLATGMDYEEIATRLGVKKRTVLNLLSKMRHRMALNMEGLLAYAQLDATNVKSWGENQMVRVFYIFRGQPNSSAMLMDAVKGYRVAQTRMCELAKEEDDNYFLFWADGRKVVESVECGKLDDYIDRCRRRIKPRWN